MATWTLDSSVGIICEIAFTTGPLDTPSWTDVSAYLDTQWQSFRGKESEDDDIQPGTLTVYLNNSARTFDPEHAAGPYFGNLKPMKKIRLRVTVGAFSAVIFTGYVLGWPQEWGTFRSVAAVQCVDGARIDGVLDATAYAAEIMDDSPVGYWPFQGGSYENLVDDGPPMTEQSQWLIDFDPVVSTQDVPIGAGDYLDMSNAPIYAADSTIGVADHAGLTAPAAMEIWLRGGTTAAGNRISARSATNTTNYLYVSVLNETVQVAYSNSADNLRLGTGVPQTTAAGVLAVGGPLRQVAVYRSGSNLVTMIDGSVVNSTALSAGTGTIGATEGIPGHRLASINQLPAAIGQAFSHWSVYTTAPSEARFRAHYQAAAFAWSGPHGDAGWEYGGARITRVLDDVNWPAADRDISPGGTLQAQYFPDGRTGMDYIRDVERSESPGIVFFSRDNKLTFRDRQWLWSRTPSVTFSDDGAGIDYTASNPRGNDVSTIRNLVTVSYARVGAITNRDQSSIDDYGEQPIGGELLECPTMGIAQDASNLGRFRTRTRGQPQTIIPQLTSEMVPSPGTQIPAVVALELGDVVAFERTPMSVGSQIVKTFIVLGIGHEVTAYQWTVRLYLSPPIASAVNAPYLTLGDATRGKVGAAFGNIVPF